MGIITDAISSTLGLARSGGWQWQDYIHPASFRGVPFGVVSGEGVFGRRIAVHEYPYKDTVYVEDLGRSTRKFTIRGFLVHDSLLYSAPDVFTQRDSLISAAEQNSSATLVHPTLGELAVYITDGGLQINEGIESERVFEFTLTCIEAGEKEFAIQTGTVSDARSNWLKTLYVTAARYVAMVTSEVNSIAGIIDVGGGVIQSYANLAQSMVDSVTNLGNVMNSTFGNIRYSRFNYGAVGGAVSGVAGVTSNERDANTPNLVKEKISKSVTDRDTIEQSIDQTDDLGAVDDIPQRVQDLIGNIANSTGSEKEKINTFEALTYFNNKNFHRSGDANTVVKHTVCMSVCMSASTMAYVALHYTPANLDEAQDILIRVSGCLERALLMCADLGNDECYKSLLEQRILFVGTYTKRFISLPSLALIRLNSPLPSLMLANRFYQDAGRNEELVQAAKPIHPAFMPIEFKAKKI